MVEIPVYSYFSPSKGKSLWLLSGIHGEEPAGPNAIFRCIDYIGELGLRTPMVVLPLLNPAGYYRNWRFHNVKRSLERLNVTDCQHLTPNPLNPTQPRIKNPVHELAKVCTDYLIQLLDTYPPSMFIDLHEDELISEGYVYSQGALGPLDPLGSKIVRILLDNDVPLKLNGFTRFPGEIISNGLVSDLNGERVKDGSVDEFIANEYYFDRLGKLVPKPYAKSSIVIETPTKGTLSFDNRVQAHECVIKSMEEFCKLVS